jgi:beta-lactamase class A
MEKSFRERAQDEIARIVSLTTASVGVCAIHVESGQRIVLNAERSFPLASTYKIPIAILLLMLVEQGQLSLAQMIEITEEDLSPGSGPIKELFTLPGVQLSIRNLLDLAIRFSDNTASDIVLRLAGGPDKVTSMIRSARIDGVRVDRSTKQILSDFYGFTDLASDRRWSLERFQTRLRETSAESRKASLDAFLNDPRDCGTPAAIASLLTMFQSGKVLNPTHTDLLLSLMRKCRTGPGRLKGQLPAGTIVAHKTGTIEGAVVNDAGIIELPDARGHIAIAAVVQGTAAVAAESEYEVIIAQLARTIFDCFLLGTD